jgi:hypothetical protein
LTRFPPGLSLTATGGCHGSPGFSVAGKIEIDAVTPSRRGFTLTGQGADRAEYRLDVHFELPLDPRTREVIGELLTQSDVTIARRNS